MTKELPLLSIVSPVYQAENLIDELVQRLITQLNLITPNFEIVLAEDGSGDRSWEKIEENCKRDPRIKGLRLTRNFGQHLAIAAGIEVATGEWIVVMDCDLQDRPEEIINLYRKALEGYEIVQASRFERNDSFQKVFFSKLFYKILSFLSGTQYDSSIANFGIYHRKVIASILRMKDSIRYFPAMVNWVGFRKCVIPVEHSKRPRGKSAYNFRRQFKLAIDIMLAYSDKPLKLIVALGVLISLAGFVFSSIIIYKYINGTVGVLGYASLITSICFFSGVIISVLGVVGLYVGKIFEGVKKRPAYLIKEKIND